MVFALVDDLLFLSKIRSTAAGLGVKVASVRSKEDAIADMLGHRPALVILDLNCRRADALATAAAMKTEPALRDVPTIAFAGHTQLDLLEAARDAGIGEVLTRGAFSEMLPSILSRGASDQTS